MVEDEDDEDEDEEDEDDEDDEDEEDEDDNNELEVLRLRGVNTSIQMHTVWLDNSTESAAK